MKKDYRDIDENIWKEDAFLEENYIIGVDKAKDDNGGSYSRIIKIERIEDE